MQAEKHENKIMLKLMTLIPTLLWFFWLKLDLVVLYVHKVMDILFFFFEA